MEPPIKFKIKKRQQPGPECIWKVNRPDLGMVGSGYLFEVLVNSCKAWRNANAWPVGVAFEEELEQVVCAQHPETCTTDDPRAFINPDDISARDILVGTEVMVRFMAAGRPIVDQAEAERRANICCSCRMRRWFSKGCGNAICGKLLELVRHIVGDRKTTRDEFIEGYGCWICKCQLQSAVWLPQDIQWKSLTEHQKIQFDQVPHCWKRPTT